MLQAKRASHVLEGLSGDEEVTTEACLGFESTYWPTEESSSAPLPKPVAMSVMLTCGRAARSSARCTRNQMLMACSVRPRTISMSGTLRGMTGCGDILHLKPALVQDHDDAVCLAGACGTRSTCHLCSERQNLKKMQGTHLLLHGWVHHSPKDEVALSIHQLVHSLCSCVHLHTDPCQPPSTASIRSPAVELLNPKSKHTVP